MGTTDGNGVYTPDLDEEGWDPELATNFDLFSQNITDTAAHVADTTAAHAASAVSFSPTGTVAATTVQTAIAEVASEAVPASLFDAKGDLITASANDTPAKLTVGADDTILMADASAGGGLKWVASASPSAVSTAAATGTADTFTRGDHVHAHEAGHTGHDTIWDTKGDLAVATGADAAAKLAVGADLTTRLVANSGQATGLAWVPYVVRKTSDQALTTSNTVLENVTGLVIAVAASEVYVFEMYLIASAASVTPDMKIGWTVPSGTTMTWGGYVDAGTAASDLRLQGVATTPIPLTESTGTQMGLGTAANLMRLAGLIVVSSTAGNVQFQAAQATSNAGAVTVKANSTILLTRIA